jgi:predicted dinucleotide-binding enzyme
MRYAVLGTGMVGQGLATKLVSLGHEVTMGSRRAGNEKAVAWASATGEGGAEGSFADAAGSAEVVMNATAGMASLDALALAGAENLAGKVLIDVSNALDFSQGMPPTLSVCNTDSVGEQIQRAYPDSRVVKAFNTVNFEVMVNPTVIPASHTLFMGGDDDDAKITVRNLAVSFGWPAADVVDLGDITAARAMEMYVVMWLRLFGVAGSPHVNVKVVQATS